MSEITTLFCVFVRCSAMLMVLPVFSAQQFPVRLRLALAGFIALVCAPTISSPIPAAADWGWAQLAMLLLQEACVGWTAGFVARLAFYTLEVFAGIVGIEIGLSAHAQFNPLSDSRSELFGLLAITLGALLVFTLDAHHWMLAAMSQTYSAAPILSPTPTQPLYYFVSGRVAGIFQAGLVMAAPVMAVTFLISITFALISRAAPTMNVFTESFSFRILAGIIVFGLTLHLTAQHISNLLRRVPADMLKVSELIALR